MIAVERTGLRLAGSLRRALERDEFVLHYQPVVDAADGNVVTVEALLRWNHPRYGLLEPEEFIGLAEETGMIVPLGAWVLREACSQAQAWACAGLPPVRVAVNLSPLQFRSPTLMSAVSNALKASGLPPDCLELELTEGVFADPQAADVILRKLRMVGVRLAIDDFGTGFSSLNYLGSFPLDTIKIDRSFISDVVNDPAQAAIVTAILAMAKELSLDVVAEGVEREDQRDFLHAHGCDLVQGFLFSSAQAPEELGRWLASARSPDRGLTRSRPRAGEGAGVFRFVAGMVRDLPASYREQRRYRERQRRGLPVGDPRLAAASWSPAPSRGPRNQSVRPTATSRRRAPWLRSRMTA
jgi:EAL domain-containing protein (putative c-di-GMP-specific phosphodiesterase class I)